MDEPEADLPDERSLIRKARWGNEQAFEALYRAHARAVHGLLFRMTGNRAVSEDLTQDTFLKLLSFRSRIDPARPLRPWLKRVAANAAIDHLRRDTRYAEWNEDIAGASDDAGTELLLEDALRRLPPLARTVVWLHEVEGWSHREIADRFGHSESWSKSLLSRSINRLRAPSDNEHE